MKKLANVSIRNPILWAVLTNRESTNWPKMVQLKHFSINSCTKSKLKGVRLMKVGHFEQMAHNGPIFNFFPQFSVQSQNSKEGLCHEKN